MRLQSEKTLRQYRGWQRCEWCWVWCNVHCHHVSSKGAGRIDHRMNVVALCPKDHQANHNGHMPRREQLIAIVAKREGVTPEQVEAFVYACRLEPKHPKPIERAEELLREILDEKASEGGAGASHRRREGAAAVPRSPVKGASVDAGVEADERGSILRRCDG